MIDDERLAQAIKVSILRLAEKTTRDEGIDEIVFYGTEYSESVLVRLLGQLGTPAAFDAFVELFDYSFDDVTANAIGEVTGDNCEQILPRLKARIGAPINPNPYYSTVPQEHRDKMLMSWVKDLEA